LLAPPADEVPYGSYYPKEHEDDYLNKIPVYPPDQASRYEELESSSEKYQYSVGYEQEDKYKIDPTPASVYNNLPKPARPYTPSTYGQYGCSETTVTETSVCTVTSEVIVTKPITVKEEVAKYVTSWSTRTEYQRGPAARPVTVYETCTSTASYDCPAPPRPNIKMYTATQIFTKMVTTARVTTVYKDSGEASTVYSCGHEDGDEDAGYERYKTRSRVSYHTSTILKGHSSHRVHSYSSHSSSVSYSAHRESSSRSSSYSSSSRSGGKSMKC
jgi:hypothetical protein